MCIAVVGETVCTLKKVFKQEPNSIQQIWFWKLECCNCAVKNNAGTQQGDQNVPTPVCPCSLASRQIIIACCKTMTRSPASLHLPSLKNYNVLPKQTRQHSFIYTLIFMKIITVKKMRQFVYRSQSVTENQADAPSSCQGACVCISGKFTVGWFV